MSEAQAPGPQMPTGTVVHSALEFWADGADPNPYPDLYSIAGLKVTFTPYIKHVGSASFERLKAAVWTGPDGKAHTLIGRSVRCVDDPAGQSHLLDRDGTPSTTDEVRLAATTAEHMIPTGWVWCAEWENGILPSGFFPLDENQQFDLSSLVVNSVVPGAAQYVQPLLERALALEALIQAGGGTGGGAPAPWGSIPNQPSVIAAGETTTEARLAIGAASATELDAKATVVRWTGTVWPTRPAGPYGVTWMSTTDRTATAPIGAVDGDVWKRLP